MRVFLICIPLLIVSIRLMGCGLADNTSIGKGVKTYEKYSDDMGKEREVKVMGKDVIVEPEADKKIRFNF